MYQKNKKGIIIYFISILLFDIKISFFSVISDYS